MLLNRNASNSLLNIESINSRIMVATFNGNPKITVILCYSQTNVPTEEDATNFYTELMYVIDEVPKHHVLIIGGDMNAKIGKREAVVSSFHENTNRNGQLLLDLMKECNLVNISTSFSKNYGKLWALIYPNGNRAQLDHILINRKWQNSAMNSEVYNILNSDHRPCSVKLRLCLRANKKHKTYKLNHNWALLSNDENVSSLYCWS